MDDQLQQLIDLQREQNQLFQKYLWRLRFSLLGLFLATTLIAIGLGIVAYRTTQPANPPSGQNFPFIIPRSGIQAPAGDIQLRSDIPGAT